MSISGVTAMSISGVNGVARTVNGAVGNQNEMGDKVHRAQEKNYLIQVLYQRYKSVYRVAEHPKVKLSKSQIGRRLLKAGLTKPRGFKRKTCVDCGKPSDGKMRCKLHKKIRDAELNLKAVRRYKARKDV